MTNGSPEDRGSADAYYGRPWQPHKIVGGKRCYKLTSEEIGAYNKAYDEEDARKSYGTYSDLKRRRG